MTGLMRTTAAVLIAVAATGVLEGGRSQALVVRVSTLYCKRSVAAFSDGTVIVTRNGRTVRARLSTESLLTLRRVIASEPQNLSWASGMTYGMLEVVFTRRRNLRTLKAPVYLPCRERFDPWYEPPEGIRYGKAVLEALEQPGLLDGCSCPSPNG